VKKEGLDIDGCKDLCGSTEKCGGFVFRQPTEAGMFVSAKKSSCALFDEGCSNPVKVTSSTTYLKNTILAEANRLHSITYAGDEAHIMAIGDWGSRSCPGRQSMHYVFPGVASDSERWKVDDDAQMLVATAMGKVADKLKPVAVINVGDNFYWGGIPHPGKPMNGDGVHDPLWQIGFEQVYTAAGLQVPWLSIFGNHDYGGDACVSDWESLMAYTYMDEMKKKRWRMPHHYFSQRIKANDFEIEIFMIDTNKFDSTVGREGGICNQQICMDVHGVRTMDKDTCAAYFDKLWEEQLDWLTSALQRSTAKWKIIAGHHKPWAWIGETIFPLAKKYGAQLYVSGHSHEIGFTHSYDRKPNSATSTLTVGAGGGAQGNPGCGDFDFCGGLQDYGFANIRIDKDAMHVMIVRWDDSMLYKEVINPDGSTGGFWAVGPWQPCVSNKRERTVNCNLGDDTECADKEKPDGTMECGWMAGEWGMCEGNQRNRTVDCLEGSVDNPNNCAHQKRLATTDPCGWSVGDWSECKDNQLTRTVQCLSVDLVGCDSAAPPTSTACGSAPTPSGPSPAPDADAEADEEKKGGSNLMVWIAVIALLAIVGGVVFYFKSNQAATPSTVQEQELTGTGQ